MPDKNPDARSIQAKQLRTSALVRYLEARADTACGTCWTSSSMPQHPECQKKIDKFFKTEDELFRFASRSFLVVP
jgi:hypothetical protein